MRRLFWSLLAIATVLAAVLLLGCSGGGSNFGSNPGAASAAITFRWPTAAAASRLMPVATQSIKVVLSDGTGFTATQVVDRPTSGNTSTVTFASVPVGVLTITATAYPQTGGLGTPQATGTAQVTTTAGQQANASLTMGSTIDHIDITAASLSVTVSGTLQLTATPKDASGNTVLVAAGNITWTSAAAGTASVNAGTGLVTGVAAGTALITARESDSNKSASVTVTVGAASGPKLILALDASQNGTGTSKVTSITNGELLNTSGAVVANATISAGTAQFQLTGLTTGTYFIRVNNLPDDLVPTRIDSTAADITQYVGNQLTYSVIGTLASPTYKLRIFSKGQGSHAVIGYTGAATTNYAYTILLMKASPQVAENRVLGTGALLTTQTHANHTFATFIIGSTNHGKNTGSCSGCHGTLTSKPSSYTAINESNGWCYKCHYGPNGPSGGMVDAAK